MKIYNKKLDGFTLSELLVVLVIISILVLLALPKLYPLVTKAKTKEAQAALATLKSLETAYKMEHDTYSTDLKELGFEQEKLTNQGGNAKYLITVPYADAAKFEAKATAVIDFDNDGVFNEWTLTSEGKIFESVAD